MEENKVVTELLESLMKVDLRTADQVKDLIIRHQIIINENCDLYKIARLFIANFIEQVKSKPFSEVVGNIQEVFSDNNIDWNKWAFIIMQQNPIIKQDEKNEKGKEYIKNRIDNIG